jgi:hypothetical protein
MLRIQSCPGCFLPRLFSPIGHSFALRPFAIIFVSLLFSPIRGKEMPNDAI